MNAYAHRIWYRPGYVQVDIYHDAVDILSPGWFIDGQDPEAHMRGESVDSSTRNELIATTLFRSGDIESSGMGIRKIRNLCDEAGVRVSYQEVSFGTKLTFHRRDPFAESLPNVAELPEWGTLSEAERAMAEVLSASDVVRTTDAAKALGIPVRTARYTLRRLVEKGIAEAHGSTRARTYSISTRRAAE